MAKRPVVLSDDGTELLEVRLASEDLADGPFGTQSLIPSCVSDGSTTVFLTDGGSIHLQDWQGLHLLYSTARTNLFLTSEWSSTNLGAHGGSPDVTGHASLTVPGYASINAFLFNVPVTVNQYAYEHCATSAGITYTISALVKMVDLSQPVVSLTGTDGDLCFVLGGARVSSQDIGYTNLGSGVWRVSISGYVAPTPINDFAGVIRYITQSGKAFSVSGLQVEVGDLTPYIKTSGTATTVTDYTVASGVVTLASAPAVGTPFYGLYTTVLSIPQVASFTTSSAVPFITSTRSDLGNSVTFVHTSANLITCSGAFAASQFNGSGAGLTLGTVSDSYTIQSLGTVTTAQAPQISNGRYIKLTLGGDIDLLIPNGSSAAATEKLIFEVTQDATGSRTIYWQAQRSFPSAITPILSTSPNAVDILEFTWNGSTWMLTNFSANEVAAVTVMQGVRPTTWQTTTGAWTTQTNPEYAYDGGGSPDIDSTTFAYMYLVAPVTTTVQTVYSGFSGVTRSGTLYVNLRVHSWGEWAVVEYSLDGGSNWLPLGGPWNSNTTYDLLLSVALTNPVLANLRVRFGMNHSGNDNGYFNVYDIVFI